VFIAPLLTPAKPACYIVDPDMTSYHVKELDEMPTYAHRSEALTESARKRARRQAQQFDERCYHAKNYYFIGPNRHKEFDI
jgi:hypothetical protein